MANTVPVDAFLRQLIDEPAWLIYLIVFTLVFVEDALFVGFVVPAEMVAILGGVSASLGHSSLTVIVVGVIAAAILGDSVGYEVGKRYGDRIMHHRWLARRRPRIDAAADFLRTKGGSAVFLARWTAFLRAVMPALAGWSAMPYRTFLPWNALGGVSWGLAVTLGGFFAGMSYQRVAEWLGGGAAAVVGAIVIVAVIVWQIRKRHHEKAVERSGS